MTMIARKTWENNAAHLEKHIISFIALDIVDKSHTYYNKLLVADSLTFPMFNT
jgi:hypothetical protein